MSTLKANGKSDTPEWILTKDYGVPTKDYTTPCTDKTTITEIVKNIEQVLNEAYLVNLSSLSELLGDDMPPIVESEPIGLLDRLQLLHVIAHAVMKTSTKIRHLID